MYNNCKIKGKEHLLVDHKGVPITLNKWARQGWSNGGDMLEEQYTLISEEKVNHFLGREIEIVNRWYFRQYPQHYNDYLGHEYYGYEPFREANPDLHDITNSRRSFDSNKKIDDSSFYKEYDKLYKQSKDEKDHKLSKKYRDNCRKMTHEHNTRTRGWNRCRTFYHTFYCVTLDVKENCLAYDEPYSIDTKTMKMLMSKAPFTHLWSEFGMAAGKNLEDIIWFSKDKLPKKAYKK